MEEDGAAVTQADKGARKGLSRRDVLKAGAGAAFAAALGSSGAGFVAAASGDAGFGGEEGGGGGDADLVLVNGRIHTMNPDNAVVSSIAISDGRIASVGRGARGAVGARVIDLRGRTVVPGIIDDHNHIVLMGNRPGYHTPLENAYSIADVQATYKARAAAAPPGAWITTIGGFHFNQFAEVRLPTLAELDAALPNNPCFIELSFFGPSVTNSLGKAFFESKGATVGADGSIASFQDSGICLMALREMLTPADRRRSVLDAMAYAVGLGVTTHFDQGAFQLNGTPADGSAHEDNFTMHLPFLDVYREGRGIVRLRINWLEWDTDANLPLLTQRMLNAYPKFGDEWVKTVGIGEFTVFPFDLGPNWLKANMQVAKAGWSSQVHSLTHTDFQTEIQGFEAVNAVTPIRDLRWVIAHVPFITHDYVERLKAIGGALNLTSWRYLAGDSINNGPPFRMIVDSGIQVGMSSDGMQIAPMNPWINMYYATTGRNALGNLINDGQQISRQEVLRLYTAANGWYTFEEDVMGTLEPGKFADLVVLSDDYFSVPDSALRHIHSELTVVGGRVVYDTGAVR